MGKALDEIVAEAQQLGAGARVGVTIVTNQDNGIASYAVGELLFQPGHSVGTNFVFASLSTAKNTPLDYFFSDRKLDIDPPPKPGDFKHLPRQPFSANATDKLGMFLSLSPTGTREVVLTLVSFGNATFRVSLEPSGNVLVGAGAPIGNQTTGAEYVVSFQTVLPPVLPPH